MTERFEQLRAAFDARLERVRGKMTDSEVANLAADMVSTARRLEEIDARELGRKGRFPIRSPCPKNRRYEGPSSLGPNGTLQQLQRRT